MAIRFLSSESVDGNITGKSIRTNTGNLFVGNGSNTTANIYGFETHLWFKVFQELLIYEYQELEI